MRGETHERSPYGYDRAGSEEVRVAYASFGRLERKLLPFGFMQKLYLYAVKLPAMLVKCDIVWTHFDKDALFTALLRSIPVLNRRFAAQISNFIWLIDNSQQYLPLKKRVISWLLGRIDRVIFLSPAEEDRFVEIFGCDRRKLQYVSFGINLDAYSEELPQNLPAAALSNKPGFLLSVGTDIHRDMDLFKRAADEMAGYEFVLATANKDFLNAEYGANTRVLKADLLEMRWLYGNCTCVVIPLKYNEHVSGCSTVLEAAAMRKPAVISDVPGIREYVVDGVTGIVVPVNDVEALKDAVLKLAGDSEYCRELGENAYNYVKGRFTSENWARAHLKLTNEVLDRRCNS